MGFWDFFGDFENFWGPWDFFGTLCFFDFGTFFKEFF